jgi:hypothetical protein
VPVKITDLLCYGEGRQGKIYYIQYTGSIFQYSSKNWDNITCIIFTKQEEGGSGSNNFQFNSNTSAIMFNTDFEMFYDLELNTATSETLCKLNHTCGATGKCDGEGECQKSSTYDISLKYSQVRNINFCY